MARSTRNSGKTWTAAADRQLRKLVCGNTPTRVIGLKLGRSPEAIYSHASKIGLSLRPNNQAPYGRRTG